MSTQDRALARRQLDKHLLNLRSEPLPARPMGGWIKAIREALGMTGRQLGNRLGVSQPRVAKLEQAECNGAITLESLQRAAAALDCKLVYALVPREPLEAMVIRQAQQRAQRLVAATAHSMALENQAADADATEAEIERLTKQMIAESGRRLWDAS